MSINQLLGAKGLLGYLNGTLKKPSSEPPPLSVAQDAPTITPTSTPIYLSNPTYNEWIFRDQLTRGHITLNCTDVASLGVVTTGTIKDAWDSIQREWGRSTNMQCSHAQEALNRTVYNEGTEIQDHIKVLQTRKAMADNLSTSVMSDETRRGIIIQSIPPTPKWLPVIPSLYMMSSSADIISTLFAHGMIIGQDPSAKLPSTTALNTVLAARMIEGCTNLSCKAKKHSTYTTANCYWPGGGKEGQFSPNFGQWNRANITMTNAAPATPPQHFVLSAQTSHNNHGQSGIMIDIPVSQSPMVLISQGFQRFQKGKVPTFMDSGVSDTMFISRDVFADYKSITPRVGDSAKAENGSFEIVGEGNVIQHYQVDRKEQNITYTHALHTLTLNANLVSVSALDNAGLITMFGNGRGITKKADGTVVLIGEKVNGMYLLEALDDPMDIPFAMASLSQPTSLEQWHR